MRLTINTAIICLTAICICMMIRGHLTGLEQMREQFALDMLSMTRNGPVVVPKSHKLFYSGPVTAPAPTPEPDINSPEE